MLQLNSITPTRRPVYKIFLQKASLELWSSRLWNWAHSSAGVKDFSVKGLMRIMEFEALELDPGVSDDVTL
jgi:hypothetical protein